MPYNFNEHKHRYAVWTAARAVQRSFTTTEIINKAINATSLREFSESDEPVTREEYDKLHREWCNQLISSFGNEIPCSYGRAAKVVSIYLKTSYIVPNKGEGDKCKVIHPPIDSIFLKAISMQEGLKGLNNERWTKFSQDRYWDLVQKLRDKYGYFDWRLEEYWEL